MGGCACWHFNFRLDKGRFDGRSEHEIDPAAEGVSEHHQEQGRTERTGQGSVAKDAFNHGLVGLVDPMIDAESQPGLPLVKTREPALA